MFTKTLLALILASTLTATAAPALSQETPTLPVPMMRATASTGAGWALFDYWAWQV